MSETPEEHRKRLAGMSNADLVREFERRTEAANEREYFAEKAVSGLASDLDDRRADLRGAIDRGEKENEEWQRVEQRAGIVAELDKQLDRDHDQIRDTVEEMKKRDDLTIEDRETKEKFETFKEQGVHRWEDPKENIDLTLERFEMFSKRREYAAEFWDEIKEKEAREQNEGHPRSPAEMSSRELVKEFERNGLTGLVENEVRADEIADTLSKELDVRKADLRNGIDNREGENKDWQRVEKMASTLTDLDKRIDSEYARSRDVVEEMKKRDDLSFSDGGSTDRFMRIGKGYHCSLETRRAIDGSLEKFKEVSELREQAFEKERARDRQPDISASRDQTDDRRPNLTQSDPDRGQKRDDAEFLGREAAHVLPQGERDRQRDAARLQNPEEKRGLEQELKPEMSLGGASEPQAAQAKGAEREKAPAQAEQKAETKAPVSALGKAAAFFDRKRDEAAKPAEQKQADQKGEQKAETKKPLSALGRAAAYFDRKQAEQPKPAEEQTRRM
ncbi:MAG: hypothetical protein ABF990_05225 [Acetobacter sp.]|uniref:hypothetical protein n=1 Tax=Acetobacter sp. TaxID=440 RepID=UPI0039ED0D18